MFRKLLIANRGEVATRIARAASGLGISTVCVSSRADLGAAWQALFGEVVCIGEAAPASSYLRATAIVQAARQTGCSAVHPGWGFLAEDPDFAALCAQHGLTFVGPPASVIERMGRKWPAKLAMRAAGLEPIPGSEGLLAGVDDAVRAAESTGYPVLLKADAGGGGRGMRLCADAAAVRAAFPAAVAEARAAFGSAGMYLEQYLDGGRHIEVQILADNLGHAVHLGERECSIQRNHQKLIEESPSPALTPEERAALGARAARAAREVGYVGAGTIEFLRHPATGRLHFMEMNTRLQVEHPVSEAVSNVDIVRAQLQIAANQALPFGQDDVEVNGHAIECRINAEDPERDFQPSPGVLETFDLPHDAGPGRVRVDTHLAQGDRVPPHYDSLIAKVIAWGETRDQALETMLRTLARSRVTGVATTIPLHLAVLDSPEFRSGEYDTRRIPGWSTAPA